MKRKGDDIYGQVESPGGSQSNHLSMNVIIYKGYDNNAKHFMMMINKMIFLR